MTPRFSSYIHAMIKDRQLFQKQYLQFINVCNMHPHSISLLLKFQSV